MQNTKPIMRYHGAKWALSSWIISHFPDHKSYIEPFGGSAALLLNKQPAKVEVYNDINLEVVNLFRVLRDDVQRKKLLSLLEMTPYSRFEYETARNNKSETCPILSSRNLLIKAQMGFGSTGSTSQRNGFRSYSGTKGGATLKGLWLDMPTNLSFAAKRLREVIIENTDAISLISNHDRPDALFYLDPPYPHETRGNNNGYGEHEYTSEDHHKLLGLVKEKKGMFVISGYDNEIYKKHLQDWRKYEKPTTISSHSGSVVRNEVIWLSPNCSPIQIDMFK